MKIKEKYNKKLLVEGNDDQHVIWALCNKLSITETFDVIDCEGKDSLKKKIEPILMLPEVETLGIIIDADQDLCSSWQSIRDILENQRFPVPQEFPKEGLIFPSDIIKIGVWIMPNNNFNGMLEDFITLLVPPNDKLMPIVDTTLEDIEKKNLQKYAAAHKSKAKIYTWLSWQENPGTPMGAGITKQILATDSETCTQLVDWLKKLFKN